MHTIQKTLFALGAASALAFAGIGSDAAPTPRPGKGLRQEEKKAKPAFTSLWKMEAPTGAKRAAYAVMAENAPQLLILDEAGTLTFHKLTGEGKAEKEDSVALGEGAEKFVVGHFAPGKPAVIVAPTAIFYRDGGKIAKKEVADIKDLAGSLRRNDGTDAFFLMTMNSPPMMYTLNLGAEKPVVPGEALPQPMASDNDFRELLIHLPPEMFENEAFPEPAKKGALARLFTPMNDKAMYGILAWQEADGAYLAIVEGGDLFPQPNGGMKPVWKSPKLAGKVLDITFGPHPKEAGKSGVWALQASGADGKGRVLEFFSIH